MKIFTKLLAALLFTPCITAYGQQIGEGHYPDNVLRKANQALPSGMYQLQSDSSEHAPFEQPSHLWVGNIDPESNRQLQIGSTAETNDRLYFRKTDSTSYPAWNEMATRGSNTFRDTQTFADGGFWGTNGTYLGTSQEENPTSYLRWDSNPLVIGSSNRFLRAPGPTKVIIRSTPLFAILPPLHDNITSCLELQTISKPLTVIQPSVQYITAIRLHSDGPSFFNGGNVGIGTTNPLYALDVRGTIRANEVLVNLTNGGADFVFDKDYRLRPLEEVSRFVKAQGHLPEIPSAAEMKAEGVNMTELQIKLLQKIEELTLYLIEQEATIEQLKTEVERLKR